MRKKKGDFSRARPKNSTHQVCSHCIGWNRSRGYPNCKEGWKWAEGEEWAQEEVGVGLDEHRMVSVPACKHIHRSVHLPHWTWTQGFTLYFLRMKLEGCSCRGFSQGLRVRLILSLPGTWPPSCLSLWNVCLCLL